MYIRLEIGNYSQYFQELLVAMLMDIMIATVYIIHDGVELESQNEVRARFFLCPTTITNPTSSLTVLQPQ